MNLVTTLSLSQKQREEIHMLTDLCRRQDGSLLSCPEDGDEFWLLYEGGCLCKGSTLCQESSLQAFFTVYKTEDSCWECYAFTRPKARNQGYFSLLLDVVVEKSREAGEPDLCFVTDNCCKDTPGVLKHLGAEFWYEEYMMDCCLKGDGEDCRKPLSCEDSHIRILWKDKEPDYELVFFLPDQKGAPMAPAGTCRLSIQGDNACLYSLEILPALRGMGVGTRFVSNLLFLLKERGCRRLRLQVSGSNEPALRLYKKTGFRITETLSYYLY